MKVLVIAHGHPKFSAGGGEVAAYSMYEALKNEGHEAYFLAWNNTQGAGEMGRPIEQITQNEWLIATKTEFFTFSSINEEAINAYKTLLESLKPDIVHFHHFIHLGIELPRLTKSVLKNVKVFLTVHEYLLLCNNNGQMITTKGQLCYSSSPQSCNQCFPKVSPEAFFMREGYLKNCLGSIDKFFSPSHFLRDRLIAWGIPSNKIIYLENILDFSTVKVKKNAKELTKVFGYFGQINFYKGLDILLDAFLILKKTTPGVRLHINGSFSSVNTPEYKKMLENRVQELGDMVIFNGPYSQNTISSRFDQVGWLVMSSRWWENSPVVIQEAIAHGKPIIVPNIGGMLEKVVNKDRKKTGLVYEASDAYSLSETISKASSMRFEQYESFGLGSVKHIYKTTLMDLITCYKAG